MTGHIRRRGKQSWELKFDLPKSGKRQVQYHSFRGTKRQAQAKLTELIASVGQGSYIEPSKTTVVEFVRSRVDQWEAGGNISARTAQRYRQLVENQITSLGDKALQKLTRLDIEGWHTTLRKSGLFANLEDRPLRPSTVSSDWGSLAERIGMPEITFHSLRHTHASQLIASGVDIVTISKRLGHAKPSVTLAIYAHMFTTDDSKAATAINAALNRPA